MGMFFMFPVPVSVVLGALAIVSALSLGSMLLIVKVGDLDDPFGKSHTPFRVAAVVLLIAVLLAAIIVLSQ